MADWQVIEGDCLDAMRGMEDASMDAVVTDPPYGLRFMGKNWDHGVPGEAFWAEALRVAKPGAHLLAFGGTRTFHRLACAVEDAGWELRDTVMWVYGGGFPKSLSVDKSIDKAAGAEREVVGDKLTKPGYHLSPGGGHNYGNGQGLHGHREDARLRSAIITAPATDAAKQWDGWGTALKPAWEPIVVARKPLEGTVAANVLKHGTGALNVDGCRVEAEPGDVGQRIDGEKRSPRGSDIWCNDDGSFDYPRNFTEHPGGRFPANLVHDGSAEVVALFPETKGGCKPAKSSGSKTVFNPGNKHLDGTKVEFDAGSAARFFYCAKASRADRDEGLAAIASTEAASVALPKYQCSRCGGWIKSNPGNTRPNSICFCQDPQPNQKSFREKSIKNPHPTVKPTALMRWLVRLVCPPEGTVLDPFCGSGSTGKAAVAEGFRFVGIDLDPTYCEIARRRIAAEAGKTALFD